MTNLHLKEFERIPLDLQVRTSYIFGHLQEIQAALKNDLEAKPSLLEGRGIRRGQWTRTDNTVEQTIQIKTMELFTETGTYHLQYEVNAGIIIEKRLGSEGKPTKKKLLLVPSEDGASFSMRLLSTDSPEIDCGRISATSLEIPKLQAKTKDLVHEFLSVLL